MTTNPANDPFQYSYHNRVRLAETDLQGVVFYGTYITYQDEATLAYLREIGHSYEDILEGEWELLVVHVDMDYHDSARFGDRLRHGVRVATIGDTSITFEYRCERERDGILLADGSVVQVVVNEDGESRPVPDELIEAMTSD